MAAAAEVEAHSRPLGPLLCESTAQGKQSRSQRLTQERMKPASMEQWITSHHKERPQSCPSLRMRQEASVACLSILRVGSSQVGSNRELGRAAAGEGSIDEISSPLARFRIRIGGSLSLTFRRVVASGLRLGGVLPSVFSSCHRSLCQIRHSCQRVCLGLHVAKEAFGDKRSLVELGRAWWAKRAPRVARRRPTVTHGGGGVTTTTPRSPSRTYHDDTT